MNRKVNITQKDIAVVLCCIIFLLTSLGAIGSSSRRRAKEAVCLSNLRQWGSAFAMYTNDNNGYFFTGENGGTRSLMGNGRFWRNCMRPYCKDARIWLCPQTVKPLRGVSLPPEYWSSSMWELDGEAGSYGLNGWILNLPASQNPANRTNGWGRTPAEAHWFTPHVKGANNIPVFCGMWWVDAWPRTTDLPPPTGAGPGDTPSSDEMNRACVNRHNGAVNGVFMDWSARKIGLKELWTLKWHRNYNTAGPWTKAGGVKPTNWPQWMKNFKDY
jgi:prepilin-type processing-associated H-X9-DG protein